MVSAKVTVTEPTGLHLRPAGMLCAICQTYQCKIELRKGNHVANAKSVLGILAARVQQGDEIELVCEGTDEQEALSVLVEKVREGF